MDAVDALKLWVAEGHIDAELAAQLQASLDAKEEPARANRLIWLLVSIGAVLIGGGLLLFVASQWDQTSPLRRLALLLLIYVLIVGAAALSDRQRLATTARGLWFLSSIAAGVNIFLIGQVFNLPLNFWQGTLLWMVATLAMGWASPSSAQGWLAIPLGLLTLAWIGTPSSEFFDQGAFLWDPRGIRPLLPLAGLGLVALAVAVRSTSFTWLATPAVAFGGLLVAVPVTVSTFHPAAFAYVFQVDVRPYHLIIVAIVLAVVGLAWYRRPHPLLGASLVAVTALTLALLPQVNDSTELLSGTGDSVPWLAEPFDRSEILFGLYNAFVLALAVATIAAGQRFGVQALVNAGFAVTSVLLVAVYVGRIAGALPTSLAVIVGGILLVGGAIVLERKRREATAEVAA